MSLSHDDIKKIAHLARLALPEKNIESLSNQMNNILNLVEQMNQVDTKNVEPMAHPYDAEQPMRADEVTEIDEHTLYQSIAPKTEAGLYLVPQVIETE